MKTGKKIVNAVVPPHGDQVPSLEEDVNDDQALVNPPPLKDENIRTTLLQMAQDITTQVQDALVKTKP